jgi:hypothetical protein
MITTKIDKPAISTEILSMVEEWEPRLAALHDKIISIRANSQNRTIRQILGHTIDSTSNNIHRIVHLQNLASPLVFPNYASFGNNDRWIAIQDYQNEDWQNMIQLWKYSLFHICHVINNVDESKLQNEWLAGPGKVITLASMIVDFTRHLKLHLQEIEDLINKN